MPRATLDLVSVTSVVKQKTEDTQNGEGLFFGSTLSKAVESDDISMVSNETRLSGKSDNLSFVGGVSTLFLKGTYIYSDAEVPCASPSPCKPRLKTMATAHNRISDLSGFGEVDLRLSRTMSITAGGRIEYAAIDSDEIAEASIEAAAIPFVRSGGQDDQHQVRFVPTLALSWKPVRGVMAFARYQRSFRPGGFQVDFEARDQVALSTFPSDHIDSVQLGIRYGSGKGPLSASFVLSHSDWSNIQADFPTINAGPSVTPIGSAIIDGVEASVTARPVKGLTLQGSLFANRTRRTTDEYGTQLPNIPGVAMAADAAYDLSPFNGADLTITAGVRYTGKAEAENLLGGPPLHQPAYTDVDAGARLAIGRYGLSLAVTNVADAQGNRFSLGDPVGATSGLQTTPLRPRSFRVGIDAKF